MSDQHTDYRRHVAATVDGYHQWLNGRTCDICPACPSAAAPHAPTPPAEGAS